MNNTIRMLMSLAIGLVFAPSGHADEVDEKMLKWGEQLWQRNCSVCHGDRGHGKTWTTRSLDPPPADFTSKKMKEHLDFQHLFDHLSDGCDKTAMQPFKYQLYEDERFAIAAYVFVDLMGKDPKGVGFHQHSADGREHGDHMGPKDCRPWNLEGTKTVSVKGRREK